MANGKDEVDVTSLIEEGSVDVNTLIEKKNSPNGLEDGVPPGAEPSPEDLTGLPTGSPLDIDSPYSILEENTPQKSTERFADAIKKAKVKKSNQVILKRNEKGEVELPKGSFGGAIYNSLVEGYSKTVNDATKATLYLMSYVLPEGEGTKQEKGNVIESINKVVDDMGIKKTLDKQLKSTEVSPEYIENLKNSGLVAEGVIGLAQSVYPMTTPYMSGFFVSGFSDGVNELNQAAPDMSTDAKMLYGTAQGAVQMALERFGFRNVLANKSVVKGLATKVVSEALLEKAEKLTANRIVALASKIVTGAAAEFETGASQYAAQEGVRQITDLFSGQDNFKFEGAESFLANTMKSGVLEGIGGGIMSTVIHAPTLIKHPKTKTETQQKVQEIQALQKDMNNPDVPEAGKETIAQEIKAKSEEVLEEAAKSQEQFEALPKKSQEEVTRIDEEISKNNEILASGVSETTQEFVNGKNEELQQQSEEIFKEASEKPTPKTEEDLKYDLESGVISQEEYDEQVSTLKPKEEMSYADMSDAQLKRRMDVVTKALANKTGNLEALDKEATAIADETIDRSLKSKETKVVKTEKVQSENQEATVKSLEEVAKTNPDAIEKIRTITNELWSKKWGEFFPTMKEGEKYKLPSDMKLLQPKADETDAQYIARIYHDGSIPEIVKAVDEVIGTEAEYDYSKEVYDKQRNVDPEKLGFTLLSKAERGELPPHESGKIIAGEDFEINDFNKGEYVINSTNGQVFEITKITDNGKKGKTFRLRDVKTGDGTTEEWRSGAARGIWQKVSNTDDIKDAIIKDEEESSPEEQKINKRKIRDEKLNNELDTLWKDFSKSQKTTSGIDPERLAKAVQIVSKYTEAGVHKLADIVEDAYLRIGEQVHELLDEIKAAYLAYQREATDEVLDLMDDVKSVRQYKFKEHDTSINAEHPRPAGAEVSPDIAGEQTGVPLESVSGEDTGESDRGKGKRGVKPAGEVETEGDEGGRGDGSSRRRNTGDKSRRGKRTGDERGAVEEGAGDGGERGGVNHIIQESDELVPKGEVAKARANISAIKLLKKLEEENREATPEENKVLVQFTGWGGLANVLDEQKADNRGTWREDEAWTKKYGKLYDEVRSLMTDDEFQSAVNSTISSHYTSAPVIKGLWNIAKGLGFKGGDILESSAGIGHIIGLTPKDIRNNSKFVAFELDKLTGAMLKKLYPESNINVTGFENSRVPPNSIDLAITNVPFGRTSPYDKAHPDLSKFSLHNYFIAKNLSQLKPGGIGIFITSSSSMDAPASEKFRDWTATSGNSDFIGAIRLPNTAFEETAKTQVTSDILVFRKRDGNPLLNTEAFKITVPIRETETKEGEPISISVNEYFARHPEMMLGQMKLAWEAGKGSLYGNEDAQTLEPLRGEDMPQAFEKAIDALPKDILKDREEQEEHSLELATEGEREGTILIKDGKIKIVENGSLVTWDEAKESVTLNGKKYSGEKVAKDYISFKADLNNLIATELSENATAEELDAARKKLNDTYDSYTDKYGTLNKNRGLEKLLGEETDFPLLQSVESVKEITETDSSGKLRRKYDITKDEVFNKRINYPRAEPTSADNISDAMSISTSYKGSIDLPYISRLTGMTEENAKKEIIKDGLGFENPETGLLESRDQYLSGFVRDKLKVAEAKGYEKNAEELRKVIPDEIPIGAIQFRLGSKFIPTQAIEDWIRQLTDATVRIKYADTTGTWIVNKISGERSPKNTQEFAGGKIPAIDLIEKALNSKQPEVRREIREPGGKKRYEKDAEATQAAQQKSQELNNMFIEYIRGNKEYIPEIEKTYNEIANGYVERRQALLVFDRFPGANSTIKLREHQSRAATRGLSESTILAHEVGSGKTYTMQTIAMERKRLGLAKKNLIVVKKATLKDFVNKFRKLYPQAKILAPTEDQMSAKNRAKLFAKIKTGDFDAIVITEPQLDKIPDRPERVAAYVNEQIEALKELANESDDRYFQREIEGQISRLQTMLSTNLDQLLGKEEGEEKTKKVKDIAKESLAIEKRLMRQSDRTTDETLFFEELGIDSLIIDEAHGFKRLGLMTNMTRVKGIDTQGAKKSLSALMKIRHVQERTGGKNVTFATGTPISNTMAELWTMMKYVRPDLLERYGIQNFDQFATMFGDVVPSLEYTAGGTFKTVDRFSKFTNVPELLTAWRGVADIVLSDDVPEFKDLLPKPNKVNIKLPQTEGVKAKISEFRAILEAWSKLKGKEKMKNRHIPLLVFNKAKQAAIDLRLINPEAEDEPGSKTNRVVEEVYERWKKWDANKTTQLVFSDMFQSPDVGRKFLDDDGLIPNPAYEKGRFNLYEDIRDKLIAKGIPSEQVAIVHDYDTDTKRESLWNKINAGEVRILFGSTEKSGTGVNVQDKLGAIHHVDAPARPMDFIQRNGRGIRQGNENKDVDILTYGVEKSLDATSYQRLAIKESFIKQMMKGNISERTMEDVSDESDMSFDEIMANLSGNQYAIVYTKKKYDLQAEQAKKKSHDNAVISAQREFNNSQLIQKVKSNRVADYEESDKAIQEWMKDGVKTVTIKGVTYDKDIGKHIDDLVADHESALRKDAVRDKDKIHIKINDRDVLIELDKKIHFDQKIIHEIDKTYFLEEKNKEPLIKGNFNTGAGMLTSINAQVRNMPDRLADLKKDLEKEKTNSETYRRIAEKTFDDSKIKELEKEVAELAEKMKEKEDTGEKEVKVSSETMEQFGMAEGETEEEVPPPGDYYIRKGKGYERVQGEPFPNKEGLDLFMYKDPDTDWTISEGRTGFRIASTYAKGDLEKRYKEQLKQHGIEKIKSNIAGVEERFGLTPRYTEPKEQTKSERLKESADKVIDTVTNALKADLPPGTEAMGFGDIQTLMNGVKKIVHAAIDAGIAIEEAIKKGLDYARNHPLFQRAIKGTRHEKKFQEAFDEFILKDIRTPEEVNKILMVEEAAKEFREGLKEGFKVGMQHQKEFQRQFNDKVKEKVTKLSGNLTAKQAKVLLNRATRVLQPSQVEKFLQFADKVISDANYSTDIDTAKTLSTSLKEKAKSDKTLVNNKDLMAALARIPVEELNDVREYITIAQEYLRSQLPVMNKNYQPFDNALAERYLEKIQKELDEKYVQSIKEKYDLAELTPEEAKELDAFLEAENEDEFLSKLSDEKKAAMLTKLQMIAEYSQLSIDPSALDLSPRSMKWMKELQEADLSLLDEKQLKEYIRTVDNAVINNTPANIGKVAAMIKASKGAKEAGKIEGIKTGTINKFERAYYSLPLLLKDVFGTSEKVANIRLLSGIESVFNGGSQSNNKVETADNIYRKFKKENKVSDDSYNNILRQVYAYIIQHSGGTKAQIQERFNNNKNKIQQSIDTISTVKSMKKIAELAQQAYNKFQYLRTPEEVKAVMDEIAPADKKAVEYWQDVFAKTKDDLRENTEAIHNEKFNDEYDYTPYTVRLINRAYEKAPEEVMSFQSEGMPFKAKQSPTTISRSKSANLPKGWSVDFDFDANMLNRYQKSHYDIATSESRTVFREFMKTAEAIKLFGGIENVNRIVDAFNNSEMMQRGAGQRDNATGELINGLTTTARNISTSVALGGVLQWLKQYPPVGLGAMVRLGKDAPLFFQSYKFAKDNPIFDKFTISERAAREGGYDRGEKLHARLNSKLGETTIGKMMDFVRDFSYDTKKIKFASLRMGDVAIAKRSWLAYYLQSLKKQGVDISEVDPETEWQKLDEPERQKAAAYAEQVVKETQIPSNPAEIGELHRASGSTFQRTFKDIFMPFSTFSSNLRARIINDIGKLKGGDTDAKKEAAQDLAAAVSEIVAFHTINLTLISTIIYPAGKQILYSLFGMDDEDKTEEQLTKDMEFKIKKWYSNIARDIVAGGFGTIVEENFIDGLNRVSYFLLSQSGSDAVEMYDKNVHRKRLMTYDEFSRQAPFYRYRRKDGNREWGLYQIILDKPGEVAQDVNAVINGEHTEDWYGKPRTKKLTEEQQDYMMFMLIMDGLALTGMNDADLYRIAQQTKREVLENKKKGSR